MLCILMRICRFRFEQRRSQDLGDLSHGGPKFKTLGIVKIKIIVFFSRTNYGNASINEMNHHLDKYIQAYTNEDPSIYRVQALGFKVLHSLQWKNY
jgi:hypothetical protein